MNDFQKINSSNYSPYTERIYNPRINGNNKLSTSLLIENNEKDKIISNQKTRIYQLEQKEKDIDTINKKYNELQKDYDNINNYKNNLEYEIKRKDNNYNTDLSLLKSERDEIKFKYNEINLKNKKLTSENDYLTREIEINKKEIERLTQKINDITNNSKDLYDTNIHLKNENKELNTIKINNNKEISKLIEDNCRLSKLCQELHISIKNSQQDNENLNNVVNEQNITIDNLTKKLNLQEENIKYLNEKINDCEKIIENLKRNIKDMNIKIEEYERENQDLKENLMKEKNIRMDEENRYKEIYNILMDKEKQIDNLNKNYENLLIIQRNLNNENSDIKIEIEKYKNNCKLLSEQNNNLINEIQNVISMHERVQNKLIRKDKIKQLLDDNKNIIQQSLKDINNNLSRHIGANSFI